jgi:hypothetical protein
MPNWLTTASKLAVVPFDRGVLATRHRQHLGVGVESCHGAVLPDAVGHRLRQRAGAACHVEHALAGPDAGRVAHHRAPGAEQRRHELFVVDLSRRTHCPLGLQSDGLGHIASVDAIVRVVSAAP